MDEAEQVLRYRSLINRRLPRMNRLIAKFVFRFLFEVHEFEGNKMNDDNLAICFGPNVLRCQSDDAIVRVLRQCAVLGTEGRGCLESISSGSFLIVALTFTCCSCTVVVYSQRIQLQFERTKQVVSTLIRKFPEVFK